MPSDRLNAALCRLTRSVLQRSREGFTRWTVVSAVDDEIYGSFSPATRHSSSRRTLMARHSSGA